ncbi:MAG: TonB-dependent receptor [Asticcacaulis sp.]
MSPAGQRLGWLAGWFSAQGSEHFTPHIVDVFTGRTIYNEDRQDKTQDAALFGQLSYDFTPRWTAVVGLRAGWSHHETLSQIDHVKLANAERMGDVVGSIRTGRLTHSVMVSYRASPDLVWYAQNADGFRTGGFNTTTLSLTTVPSAYLGDHLDNYETGVRWQTSGGAFHMNLSVFHIRWRDIQSDQLRQSGLPITLNLGDGVNTGIEIRRRLARGARGQPASRRPAQQSAPRSPQPPLHPRPGLGHALYRQGQFQRQRRLGPAPGRPRAQQQRHLLLPLEIAAELRAPAHHPHGRHRQSRPGVIGDARPAKLHRAPRQCRCLQGQQLRLRQSVHARQFQPDHAAADAHPVARDQPQVLNIKL